MTADADTLLENYKNVRQRILAAAGNSAKAAEITLIAVTKTHPVEAIETLYHAGHRDFGENYAQELITKAAELERRGCSGVRWHFIGHLQTNKAKLVVPHIQAIHSIDSEKLARELAKRWKTQGRTDRLHAFIEINVGGEETKSGIRPEEARSLAGQLAGIPELRFEGLMCIPPPGQSSQAFALLRELEAQCRPFTTGKLSMGMTDDFETAIRQGATHLRVGSAIFGKR